MSDSESRSESRPIFCYLNSKFKNGPFLAISNNNENSLRFFIRAYAQNTTNSSISLVVNNVISFLIGPRRLVPITSIMHHMGEGARLCAFSVTGNVSGRVTKPKNYQCSGPNLGMIPQITIHSGHTKALWKSETEY